jgi:hypothetical protein
MGISACAGDGIRDPVRPVLCTDIAPFRPTLTCIQQFVFTPTCAVAGCHLAPGAQQGMDLSAGEAYAHIVGVPSAEVVLNRVEPGEPDLSYLILKLEGDPAIVGDRMPLGGPYLAPDQIGAIRDWIAGGALDD